MSKHEFDRAMAMRDEPFYGLIMAAIYRADSSNLVRLQSAFPAVFAEAEARYNAPGGLLPGEGSVG